jgi:hypothetical protein
VPSARLVGGDARTVDRARSKRASAAAPGALAGR